MYVEYDFPGSITINLEMHDLISMQQRGFTVERAGFSGIESKTWVHLPSIDVSSRCEKRATADIEQGSDLHVRLFRGFLPPVLIEQVAITNTDQSRIEHFLGKTGVIMINI